MPNRGLLPAPSPTANVLTGAVGDVGEAGPGVDVEDAAAGRRDLASPRTGRRWPPCTAGSRRPRGWAAAGRRRGPGTTCRWPRRCGCSGSRRPSSRRRRWRRSAARTRCRSGSQRRTQLSCSRKGRSGTKPPKPPISRLSVPRTGKPGGNAPRASWWWCRARPSCRRLLPQAVRLAASRTFWTAGTSRPISTAMMAMTTSSSMRVKAVRFTGASSPKPVYRPPGRGEVRVKLRDGSFPTLPGRLRCRPRGRGPLTE